MKKGVLLPVVLTLSACVGEELRLVSSGEYGFTHSSDNVIRDQFAGARLSLDVEAKQGTLILDGGATPFALVEVPEAEWPTTSCDGKLSLTVTRLQKFGVSPDPLDAGVRVFTSPELATSCDGLELRASATNPLQFDD